MTTSKLCSRLKTDLWSIGHPIQLITGCKLPSNGDILRKILFLTRIEKKRVKESSTRIIQDILHFWVFAVMLTMSDYNRK